MGAHVVIHPVANHEEVGALQDQEDRSGNHDIESPEAHWSSGALRLTGSQLRRRPAAVCAGGSGNSSRTVTVTAGAQISRRGARRARARRNPSSAEPRPGLASPFCLAARRS